MIYGFHTALSGKNCIYVSDHGQHKIDFSKVMLVFSRDLGDTVKPVFSDCLGILMILTEVSKEYIDQMVNMLLCS